MLGLGIDTGGTYTDAVLYDCDARQVLASAKALTTRHDLAVGIGEVLAGLPPAPLHRVARCSLSTTLATNACVEGKGARAALVLLGYDRELLARLGPEYGLAEDLDLLLLPGCHGQHGEVREEPDWRRLRRLAREWRDRVEAFGVVEYWGLRDPAFETVARDLLVEETGLPVVCAHELSGELNSLRRAATTLLNARLIPTLAELLDAVQRMLKAAGITAPLSIVRGDGSLMSADFARFHPIETLLSGPAASVLGGLALSARPDAIVVDMGGTTTDVAVIVAGRPRMAEEGAEVGTWRTGTRSISLHTIGLGGDSALDLDTRGRLRIGPERVAPLSWLAWAYPETSAEMSRLAQEGKRSEFLLPVAGRRLAELTGHEEAILECLRVSGPLSLPALAGRLETYPQLLPLARLLRTGVLLRSALTPTDLLHVTGGFVRWSVPAAALAAETFAMECGLTVTALAEEVARTISQRIYTLLVEAIAAAERAGFRLDPSLAAALAEAFSPRLSHLILHARTDLPLIGVGAPAAHYLPAVAEALGTEAVIPAEAPVANAVGAIAGWIAAEERVAVLPDYTTGGIAGYTVHSTALRQSFSEYDQALSFARRHGEELTRSALRRRGGVEPFTIEIAVEEERGETGGIAAGAIFLGATVTCRGQAAPWA